MAAARHLAQLIPERLAEADMERHLLSKNDFMADGEMAAGVFLLSHLACAKSIGDFAMFIDLQKGPIGGLLFGIGHFDLVSPLRKEDLAHLFLLDELARFGQIFFLKSNHVLSVTAPLRRDTPLLLLRMPLND